MKVHKKAIGHKPIACGATSSIAARRGPLAWVSKRRAYKKRDPVDCRASFLKGLTLGS
jgi:hypothetical protein